MLRSHPSDGDALSSRALTADDLHRVPGDPKRRGEERDERLVGGAFDWRRGNANQQRVVANAGAGRFSGARDHANIELDALGGLTNQSCQEPRPDPCMRRAWCVSTLSSGSA
jgi:hypothetical protein